MAEAEDPGFQSAASRRLIAVFGGTGFLGRCVVRHLLGHGFEVRAASRHPERVPSGTPGLYRTDLTAASAARWRNCGYGKDANKAPRRALASWGRWGSPRWDLWE